MNIGYAQKRRKTGNLVLGAVIELLDLSPAEAREIVKQSFDELDPWGDGRPTEEDLWESVS